MTDRAINYSLFAQSYSAKQSSIHRTLKAPTERERKKRDRDSAVSDYFPISPLLVLEIQVVTTLYDSVHWKVTTSADFPPTTLSLSLSLSISPPRCISHRFRRWRATNWTFRRAGDSTVTSRNQMNSSVARRGWSSCRGAVWRGQSGLSLGGSVRLDVPEDRLARRAGRLRTEPNATPRADYFPWRSLPALDDRPTHYEDEAAAAAGCSSPARWRNPGLRAMFRSSPVNPITRPMTIMMLSVRRTVT